MAQHLGLSGCAQVAATCHGALAMQRVCHGPKGSPPLTRPGRGKSRQAGEERAKERKGTTAKTPLAHLSGLGRDAEAQLLRMTEAAYDAAGLVREEEKAVRWRRDGLVIGAELMGGRGIVAGTHFFTESYRGSGNPRENARVAGAIPRR